MKKYNVDLKFVRHNVEVEAESEQEAIMEAIIKVTNNPYDFFTARDEYTKVLINNFDEYHDVELIEDEDNEEEEE